MQRRGCAIDAQAGLIDVTPFVLAVAVGVFGSEKNPARRRVEFGHVIENFGDVARTAPAIGGRGQEHAELVDLEQDRRLAVDCGQQPCTGGNLVAAEIPDKPGFDEELVDDLAGVVLARSGIGDADDVQIAAQIALGAVLAPHQGADRAQTRSQR